MGLHMEGKLRKNGVNFKRTFRLQRDMGSLNLHYYSHIKWKYVCVCRVQIVSLLLHCLKSPVSIKGAMIPPLKLVLQSGATGWQSHSHTTCACKLERSSVCLCACPWQPGASQSQIEEKFATRKPHMNSVTLTEMVLQPLLSLKRGLPK